MKKLSQKKLFPEKANKRDVKKLEVNEDDSLQINQESALKASCKDDNQKSVENEADPTDPSKHQRYRELIKSLFKKTSERPANAIWVDEDCNTDEDQVFYDQTQLKWELLRTVREQLPPIQEDEND